MPLSSNNNRAFTGASRDLTPFEKMRVRLGVPPEMRNKAFLCLRHYRLAGNVTSDTDLDIFADTIKWGHIEPSYTSFLNLSDADEYDIVSTIDAALVKLKKNNITAMHIYYQTELDNHGMPAGPGTEPQEHFHIAPAPFILDERIRELHDFLTRQQRYGHNHHRPGNEQ